MTCPRFTVLAVHGYLTARTGGDARPHVSATVYDRLLDQEIHTYRSEARLYRPGVVGGMPCVGVPRTLAAAEAHAAELNAKYAA